MLKNGLSLQQLFILFIDKFVTRFTATPLERGINKGVAFLEQNIVVLLLIETNPG